jgi:hypothetical protein
MTSTDWWIIGSLIIFLGIQGLFLFVYLRITKDLRSSMSRLQHTLVDTSSSNANVERAYNRLLLHNGRVLEERWGTNTS